MFQKTKERLQVLLDVVDEMLVGVPEPEEPALHPHHRSVQLRLQRRPGAVGPRQMHCLSPVVRAPARPSRREPVR